MYGKLAMTCFKYQVYLRCHHILECFPLGDNRAKTMGHHTAPTGSGGWLPPTTGSPPPSLYGSITSTYLEENSSMVKLPKQPVWLRNYHM